MNKMSENNSPIKNIEEYLVKWLNDKGIKVDINDIIVEDKRINCYGYFEFRIDGFVKIHKDNLLI